METDKKTLLEEVDAAAAALLRRAFGDDVAPLDEAGEGDTVPVKVSIVEQVKAFDSVTKYLELRHELVPTPPPDEKKPPIDRIRRKFHGANGAAASRRGSRAAQTEDDGGGLATGET